MGPRSRGSVSNPPTDEIHVLSSDSDSACSDDGDVGNEEELNDGSGEDVYVPSSDSDSASSDHEDELYGEPKVDKYHDLPAPTPAPIGRVNAKRRYMKRKRERQVLMWQVWEQEHHRLIDEHLTADFDLDQQNEVNAETAEAPPDLIMPLLRYQKEWLAWGLKQEESPVKGGILADEMGMGKTIQAISLVLAKREIDRTRPGVSKIKTTLVLCPLVAVTQWVSEIERVTSTGSTKVLLYHGPNREKRFRQFADYDFVITTYSTVEAEYRKYMVAPKDKCQYCGKSFYSRRLAIHLKFHCGPNAVKTEKQSKQEKKNRKGKATVNEVNKRKGTRKKTKQAVDKDKETLHLHSVMWNRIILDEAHHIKDRLRKTSKAVFALESSYRWALSGTPFQNRVGELYSLIRFLRALPYAYYLCKDCDCRVLNHRTSTDCPSCSHRSYKHFCWWNRYVAKPIQSSHSDDRMRAMILLKHIVLKGIVLRRTKKGRAADLALPPRTISLRREALDAEEADYYQSLLKTSQEKLNSYIQAGTVMYNYAHLFDLLTRLRQAVDHPYLVVYSSSAATSGSSPDSDKGEQVSSDTEQICGICHEPAEDPAATSCGHVFCKACLIGFSTSLGKVLCPSCSESVPVDWTTKADAGGQTQTTKTTVNGFKASSIMNRIPLDDFKTSTKIEALKEEIRLMVERDGSAKAIVFSQFTSFLDLINYSLHKCGVSCVQLEGSMSRGARDAAIKRFTEDPDCRIFLMSVKAGGIALNLTVASNVFMMDPWWNPAVERQAQDRIHRIGQCKPIRIVKFVIENTVEERILKLQEKKDLAFEGTVDGTAAAIMGKLAGEDMQFLFHK